MDHLNFVEELKKRREGESHVAVNQGAIEHEMALWIETGGLSLIQTDVVVIDVAYRY